MKIAGFIPEFPDQTHIAVWRLLNSLQQCGNDICIVSTRANSTYSCKHKVLLDIKKNSVFYLYPPNWLVIFKNLISYPKTIIKVFNYIYNLDESSILQKIKTIPLLMFSLILDNYCKSNKVDFIFLHSFANSAHIVSFCREIGGPPYALRLGGDLNVYGHDHQSKINNASFILAAAHNNKEEVLKRYDFPNEKIYVSWFGVDTNRFIPKSFNSTDYENRRLNLITVSRLHKSKGHYYILKALSKLRLDKVIDFKYTIVGTGPHFNYIKQNVKDLDLVDNVIFAGSLSEDDIIEELQDSDLFILASYGVGEAAPMAVIEALSTGVPVLCTDIGDTKIIVKDSYNGFIVDQKNEDHIFQKLNMISSNVVLLNILKKNAREDALNRFECRIVGENINNIIRKCI